MKTCSPREGHQMQTLALNQLSSPLPLFGMKGMQNGLSGLVVLGIPEAGTMVQNGYRIILRLLEPVAQGLTKECMIAIPLSLVIQRHHKYIGTLEPFQHLLAPGLLHDGITERGIETFEDAGGQQKGLHIR